MSRKLYECPHRMPPDKIGISGQKFSISASLIKPCIQFCVSICDREGDTATDKILSLAIRMQLCKININYSGVSTFSTTSTYRLLIMLGREGESPAQLASVVGYNTMIYSFDLYFAQFLAADLSLFYSQYCTNRATNNHEHIV